MQAKDTDVTVAPVQREMDSEVLSSFPSISARAKDSTKERQLRLCVRRVVR